MEWQVDYYRGRLPLETVTSDDMPWSSLPTDGVIFVTVEHGGYRRQLRGVDRYWLHGTEFGGYIVDDDQYPEGGRPASYRASDNGFADTGGKIPPGVHTLSGAWMPDDEAREVGL